MVFGNRELHFAFALGNALVVSVSCRAICEVDCAVLDDVANKMVFKSMCLGPGLFDGRAILTLTGTLCKLM